MGWIKSVKDKDAPFFAYITTNAPHGPFIAPPSNAKRFHRPRLRENAGRLLRHDREHRREHGPPHGKLDEWKLYEDTILIFMSDNGMTGGGSGNGGRRGALPKEYPFYNAGQKGLKGSADEGGVRVPFFVRWDGKFKAGHDIDLVSAHIDVLPTFAEIAGAKLPEGQVEGRSVLPELQGKKMLRQGRYLFTQKARWKTGAEPNDHQWQNFAVRGDRFRLVGNALYDMLEDPGQKTDVAAKHPEKVKEMREAYDAFWKHARPLMVNEDAPMSKTRPFHEWYKKQMAEGGIPDWTPPAL